MTAAVDHFPGLRLLEEDDDLGSALDTLRREDAARRLRAALLVLPRGEWDPAIAQRAAGGLGVLVLDGVVMRDVVLAGSRSTELISSGDVVDPADRWTDDRLVAVGVEWTIVEEARLAILDAGFLARAALWPEIISALFERVADRSFRLTIHAAISQLGHVELRLSALMWHLAERWGRVCPGGIILPLRLSHATLGRLVGARRPTITLALKALRERGEVTPRPDGGWLLAGDPPAELTGIQRDARRRVVRNVRVQSEAVEPTLEPAEMLVARADDGHASLHDRVAALRAVCESQQEATTAVVARARDLRVRSAELRAQVNGRH